MKKLTVAVCVAGLVVASCSPGDEAAESTTTSTAVTSTTQVTTTTSAPTTSTTVPATTSTTAVNTTTTTVATTTSTAAADTIEMTDEGIYVGDDWYYFGYDDDDAMVAAVSVILGPTTFDSGWDFAGICPSPNLRSVGWGSGGDVSFRLLFTDGDTDFWIGGVRHFFTYQYSATSDPTDLTTTEGIGVGSTLGDLKGAYDITKINIEESPFDPAQGFWSYDLQSWTGMWGFATGQDDSDTIISINGGRGCGE